MSSRRKKFCWKKKNIFFFPSLKSLKNGVGSGADSDPELDPDPDPLVRSTDPGIRIRTKMLRIPPTLRCGRVRHTPVRYLGDSDVRDEGVELVGGVLVLVPQPGQADAHPDQHTVMDPDQGSNTPISGMGIR